MLADNVTGTKSLEKRGIRKSGLQSALLPVDAQASTFVKSCCFLLKDGA